MNKLTKKYWVLFILMFIVMFLSTLLPYENIHSTIVEGIIIGMTIIIVKRLLDILNV